MIAAPPSPLRRAPGADTSFAARMSHWSALRIVLMATMILATVIITPRMLDLVIPPEPSPWRPGLVALRNLLVAAALVRVYISSVRLLEHRAASEVDLREGTVPLLAGCLVGAALISVVYLILWTLGRVTFAPGTGTAGL